MEFNEKKKGDKKSLPTEPRMSLQALLFQKQAGNNGKLIGMCWDDGEMIQLWKNR